MDKEKRFDEFSRAVTRGLKDDVELQLDVSQEIKSHVEDAYESFKAEGKSDDESAELAISSFGPSESIGEDLINANKRRMKLRSIARLIVRAAVVPIAVIFALFLCFHRLMIFKISYLLNNPNKFLLAYENSHLQKKETLWKKHPENKVYHGDYITHFIDENRNNYPEFFEEMEKAEKFEPDNARYNYLLAGVMLEQAIKTNAKGKTVVIDRKLLDEAINEIIKGSRKPNYKRYSMDLLRERLKAFKNVHLEDKIGQIALAAGTLLPDLNYMRNIGRTIPFYAEQLAEEGKKEKAKELLDCWFKIIKDMNSDGFCLIDELIMKAIANMDAPEAYKKAGFPEEAEKAEKFQKLINEPFDKNWPRDEKGKRIYTEKTRNFTSKLTKNGGLLACMLMPALGEDISIDEDELLSERELEFIVAERYELNLILLILLAFMFVCGFVVIMHRIFGKEAPFLLLPDFKEGAKILGWGILAPLFIYFLYSRVAHYSLRGFDMKCALQIALGLFSLLAVSIIFMTTGLAKKFILKRCRELGIAVETKKKSKLSKLPVIILVLMWISVFIVNDRDFVLAIAVCSWIFIAVSFLLVIVRAWKTWMNNDFLFSTIARSLVPVFAFAIILTGGIIFPVLEIRERHLVKNDEILCAGNHELPGFTKIESDLVMKLKGEIREAIKKSEEPDLIP